MKTAKVEFSGKKSAIGDSDNELFPTTFISLDPYDKLKYEHFRESHKILESVVRDLSKDEREARENEMREMFKEFISPYLKQSGLESARCFSYYGNSNLTLLSTPPYALFSEDEPFSFGYEISCAFSASEDGLSCQSYLKYFQGNSYSADMQKRVIDDLFLTLVENEGQNGKQFALVKLMGDFTYFAPVDAGMNILLLIRDVAMKIGPEGIKELVELREAYGEQASKTYWKNETAEKALLEAYQTRLRLELVKAKLIEPM